MRFRSRTLLIGLCIFAVFLGLCGLYIRQIGQQQRIAEQQLQIAELQAELANFEAAARGRHIMGYAPTANVLHVPSSDQGSTIGVPWGVEKAMLMDGMAPQQQHLSR